MVTGLACNTLWLGREGETSCQPGELNCPVAGLPVHLLGCVVNTFVR